MNEAWIIDTARTPRAIGKVGKGALADTHPQRILSSVLKALCGVGENFGRIDPAVGALQLADLLKIERCERNFRAVQATKAVAHELIRFAVVDRRRLPAHSTNHADGLHGVLAFARAVRC